MVYILPERLPSAERPLSLEGVFQMVYIHLKAPSTRLGLKATKSTGQTGFQLQVLKVKQIWPPLSLEGVSQMAYILPERLLALVRPAFDLVLRRIRSLKRCVQA